MEKRQKSGIPVKRYATVGEYWHVLILSLKVSMSKKGFYIERHLSVKESVDAVVNVSIFVATVLMVIPPATLLTTCAIKSLDI